MNILVVHQFYLRPGQPGGPRFNELARFWREDGHDVHVVASSVSYTAGTRPRTRWPWSSGREVDIDVVRTWAAEHRRGVLWRRAASMLGYAGLGTLAATLRGPRPDVVIASSPTLAALVPGLFAASRWQCPLIVEVRDLWPESLVSLNIVDPDAVVTRATYGFEEAAYELADCVVALTPGIRDRLVRRGVVEPDRVAVIPNGVDLESLRVPTREEARRRLGWGSEFVAVYAGAHGVANGLDQLIDAAELLRAEDVRLLAVGDGPERAALRSQTNDRGLLNLRWLDSIPREELFTVFAAADAGIVCLRGAETFRTVYPNKMFDYMAAALPVVLGVEGVAAALVLKSRAGLCFTPEHPGELARALLRLKEHPPERRAMGRRGHDLVQRRFDRKKQAQEYLAVMRDVAGHPHGPSPGSMRP